jgi:Cys-rich protein (TIGR01571 family)
MNKIYNNTIYNSKIILIMGGWDFKIFDCAQNIIMCLWGCFVPCGYVCMQALDAKLTDSDKNAVVIAGALVCCLGCLGGIINRYRLRQKLSITDESVLLDVLFWWFLPCCAVTQEYMQVMKVKKGNEKLPIWEAYKD